VIFEAHNAAIELPLSHNVSPTSQIFVLVSEDDSRVVRNFSWGLIPTWSKDASRAASLINARSETVAEKPSFRNLIARHRCVIPMDGYYEWKELLRHDETKLIKQPYFFSASKQSKFSHAGMLGVAGLWTTWKNPNDTNARMLHTVVALTRAANDMVGDIHHRMPVLLDDDGIRSWLSADLQEPLMTLLPIENDALQVWPVSTKVNNARNNGQDLIEPIAIDIIEPEDELRLF